MVISSPESSLCTFHSVCYNNPLVFFKMNFSTFPLPFSFSSWKFWEQSFLYTASGPIFKVWKSVSLTSKTGTPTQLCEISINTFIKCCDSVLANFNHKARCVNYVGSMDSILQIMLFFSFFLFFRLSSTS